MNKFGANKIIKQYHNLSNFSSFYVGFDLNDEGITEYRIDKLVEMLISVIPEFAFGYHIGEDIPITKLVPLVKESARSIYKIEAFRETREMYSSDPVQDITIEKKYLKRGEFGELILHLLLRDFYDTVPLLSKIYFKDTYGATVHGFDAIHIEASTKKLWLGESKLYSDGKSGVSELINDIKHHFTRNYLDDEFTIVSKKIALMDNIPEKDYWLNLLDSKTRMSEQLDSICIPLLCTYTCNIFNEHTDDNSDDFIKAFEDNVTELEQYFTSNNNHPLRDKLKIVLILFPVKCKNELIKKMHNELTILSGGI